MANKNQDGRKLSVTEQWKERSAKAVEVVLPSGLTVKMKKPAWMACLKMGVIPTRLFRLAMGYEKAEVSTENGQEKYEDTIGMMQAYAVACCVEPRFVLENPTEGQILVSDIDDEDLLTIFNKGQELAVGGKGGEGEAVQSFRNGTDGGDAGRSGAEVSPAAQPASSDK